MQTSFKIITPEPSSMKELLWLLQQHPDQPVHTLLPGLIPGSNDQLSFYDAQKPQMLLQVHCES